MKSSLSNDEKLAELITNVEELSELVPKKTVIWTDHSAKKERINWIKKKVNELEERFEELKERKLEEQFQNFYFGEEDEKIETPEIKNLTIERQTKKSELEQLVNDKESQLNEDLQEWLDNLLEIQEELIKSENQNKFFQKQLERAKRNLNKKLSEEEINSFLVKQEEIIKLEKKLEQLQSTQLKTQIIVPPK